jgi:hypothetical protein
MATFKHTGGVNKFRDKLITGMIDNGYDQEFAERNAPDRRGDADGACAALLPERFAGDCFHRRHHERERQK